MARSQMAVWTSSVFRPSMSCSGQPAVAVIQRRLAQENRPGACPQLISALVVDFAFAIGENPTSLRTRRNYFPMETPIMSFHHSLGAFLLVAAFGAGQL